MTGKKLSTPCVQVAVDSIDKAAIERVCRLLSGQGGMIIEAGTPTIKMFGIGICEQMSGWSGGAFIVADLKTMDVGDLEVVIASKGGADAAICSGVAEKATIDPFISECRKKGIVSFVDMMNVKDPVALLKSLAALPDGVSLHRGISAELAGEAQSFSRVRDVKSAYPKLVVASAGGINEKNSGEAIAAGADILVAGRFITGANDPVEALKKIRDTMGKVRQ
ncbi:Bifunctional enzyme Fae/Hps [uncultured archaeon]|nr:Bifunctional enzyme Fae/Hps [uncultured archaeon]